MDKTIRRITDLKAQRDETYRYWQSRPIAEQMGAVAQIVRDVYALKGIDLEKIPSDRSLVRVANRDWKAASREHLIKNKIAIGRHQDLADVEKLRNSGSQADNS